MWSYCRTVYMPMSYIYGRRFSGPITPLIEELREELVLEPYAEVDWSAARNRVAQEDLYTPHTWLLDAGFAVFNAYEKVAPRWLRTRALEWVYAVLEKEDEFTNFIDIGPVNKVLCVCVRFRFSHIIISFFNLSLSLSLSYTHTHKLTRNHLRMGDHVCQR